MSFTHFKRGRDHLPPADDADDDGDGDAEAVPSHPLYVLWLRPIKVC